MHFTTTLVAIGSIASVATAAATPGFEFPDAVPMNKRQADDPSYNCHASCGYAIKDSRNEGYCKNDKWLGLLKDCLDCALKYEIWQWYGDKVGAAAKACGLDATPVDPNAGGDSTSEAPQPQTSAPGGQPTEKPTDKPVPEPTTSAHEGGNTQAHTEANTGAHTTPVASTPGAVETDKPVHTTAAPKPTGGHGANSTESAAPTVPTGAAAGIQQPVALALGAVVVFAANLM